MVNSYYINVIATIKKGESGGVLFSLFLIFLVTDSLDPPL